MLSETAMGTSKDGDWRRRMRRTERMSDGQTDGLMAAVVGDGTRQILAHPPGTMDHQPERRASVFKYLRSNRSSSGGEGTLY